MQFYAQEKLCSLDAKGRVRLPSAITNPMGEENAKFFVLKLNKLKGILQVYTMKAWEQRTARLLQVDSILEENEEFLRRQITGTHRVERDSSGRIAIPKHVLELLGFKENVMVTSWLNRIEIWSPDRYAAYLADESYDMAAESRRIFGEGNLKEKDSGNGLS